MRKRGVPGLLSVESREVSIFVAEVFSYDPRQPFINTEFLIFNINLITSTLNDFALVLNLHMRPPSPVLLGLIIICKPHFYHGKNGCLFTRVSL